MHSGYLASAWAKRLCAWVLLCALLGTGAPALAESPADVRARSLALFKESASHYEAGRYAVAAALLEEAYALHPEPKLLYNLGRSRESVGELKRALEAYEAYLRTEPAAERRAAIEERIEVLRTELELSAPETKPASEGSETPSVKSPEAPSRASEQQQAPPHEQATRPRPIVPWALVGAGGAVLGGALTLGLIARSGHRQAEQESVQSEAVKLQRSAERRALVANLLAGAGGALAIAGGVWLVLGKRREASKRRGSSDDLAWQVHVGPSRVQYWLSF